MSKRASRLLSKIKALLYSSRARVVIVAAVFVLVGTTLLLLTRAASVNPGIETENGTPHGVTTNSDNNASGGHYVQFGSVMLQGDDCHPTAYQGYDLPDTSGYSKTPPAGQKALFVDSCYSGNTDGTETNPYKTITAAVKAANAGDLIILHGRVYREAIGNISKKLLFQAYPGEKPWIDGATKLVSGWSQSGSVWSISWNPSGLCRSNCQTYNDQGYPEHISLPCARYYRDGSVAMLGITRTTTSQDCATLAKDIANPPGPIQVTGTPTASLVDQVYFNDAPLKQIICNTATDSTALKSGQFCIVYHPNTGLPQMYVWLPDGVDPNSSSVVEASTSAVALNAANTSGTLMKGIGVRHFANNSQDGSGAVFLGDNMTVQDSIIGWSAGSAVWTSGKSNDTFQNTQVVQNGFSGVHGFMSVNLVVRGGRYAYNNMENFAKDGKASAASAFNITAANGFVVEDAEVDHNNAHGIWTSIGTDNAIFVRNYAHDNARAGLYYERSQHGIFASNKVVRNNTDHVSSNYGIKLSSSTDTAIVNNTLVDNYVDIGVDFDGRDVLKLANPTGVYIRGIRLQNNLIVRSSAQGAFAGRFITAATRPEDANQNVTPSIDSFFTASPDSQGGVVNNGFWRPDNRHPSTLFSLGTTIINETTDYINDTAHPFPLTGDYTLNNGIPGLQIMYTKGRQLGDSLAAAICHDLTAGCVPSASVVPLGVLK